MKERAFTGYGKLIENQTLYEMSNLPQADTGLPMMVFISPRGNAQHGPRIKVQRTTRNTWDMEDTFVVSVSERPEIIAGDQGSITSKELEQVYGWISLNSSVLVELWNNPKSMLQTLSKLESR